MIRNVDQVAIGFVLPRLTIHGGELVQAIGGGGKRRGRAGCAQKIAGRILVKAGITMVTVPHAGQAIGGVVAVTPEATVTPESMSMIPVIMVVSFASRIVTFGRKPPTPSVPVACEATFAAMVMCERRPYHRCGGQQMLRRVPVVLRCWLPTS